MSLVNADCECLPKCRSAVHGNKIVSALTRRLGIELLAYIRYVCSNYAHVTDKFGRNALHMAASCGQKKILEWLLEHDRCDPNVKDWESGWTALHRSLYYGQLAAVKVLIEHGANLQVRDNSGFTPLDLIIRDRLPYVEYSLLNQCEVYVWGCNTNFNLGHEKQQSLTSPEIVELFKREKLSIKQVVMNKYHTIFLAHDGKVFSCGHGRDGRLGQDSERTVLAPKQINALSVETCVQVAAGTDHTVFLTKSGSVWTCGGNSYHQLGHYPPPDRLLTPKVIRYLKGSYVIGIAAAQFHTVVYTDNALFTFGLNAGQLGHMKGEKTEINPRIVSPINCKEGKIELVCVSDGATVCTTSKGDIFVLNQYQCRKIASKQMDILSLAAVGGHLDPKCNANVLKENGGMELKIVMLTKRGKLYLWQESSLQFERCIFTTKSQHFITNFALARTCMLLVTNNGEGYYGTILSRNKKVSLALGDNSSSKKMDKRNPKQDPFLEGGKIGYSSSKSFMDFIDKDSCEKISIERLSGVHRAVASACDPKGKNFAIIQAHPSTGTLDAPTVSSSNSFKHMGNLLDTADCFDNIHDVILNVSGHQFPAHKYILASKSEYFNKLFLEKLARNTVNDDSVLIDNILPQVFIHILKYIYTNWCNFLDSGYKVPESMITPIDSSSPRQENKNKPLEKLALKRMVDAAHKLGLSSLVKELESVVISNGIVIKKAKISKHSTVFARKKHSHLYDIGIVCENDIKIQCHKCILVARLEYFYNMFASEWLETATSDAIHLPVPANVMELVIDYLYADDNTVLQKCEDADFLCKILVVADQLLITRLKEMCECALVELLTLKNATEFLEFSCIYSAKQLQTTCMEFICINLAAVIDNKSLNILSDDALDLLSKKYQTMIPSMEYRLITPYSDSPSEEDVRAIALDQSFNSEDHFKEGKSEILNSTKKQKVKRKPRVHKSSLSQTPPSPLFTMTDTDDLNLDNNVESLKEEEYIPEITSSMPIAIPTSGLRTSNNAVDTHKNPVSSLDSEYAGWIGRSFSGSQDLKDIMLEQEEENCKTNLAKYKIPHNDYRKSGKLSQKQRKKISYVPDSDSESQNSPCASTHQISINPWGVKNDTSMQSFTEILQREEKNAKEPKKQLITSTQQPKSPPIANPWSPTDLSKSLAKEVNFVDIVNDERTKSASTKRVQPKSFHLIQIEEAAIEELLKFYNASENCDEIITVQRIMPESIAGPVWKFPHK